MGSYFCEVMLTVGRLSRLEIPACYRHVRHDGTVQHTVYQLLLPCMFSPPPRKKKTNYFIVSLAFADLLVALVVMPFAAIELTTGHWRYGEIFCLVRTSLDVLLTTASILHLCCIALDRFVWLYFKDRLPQISPIKINQNNNYTFIKINNTFPCVSLLNF